MPVNAMQALAQSYADWRKSIVPFLEYSAPLQHQGTVDVVINGLRVQDKLGRAHGHRTQFYFTKRPYNRPYDHDDFCRPVWIFPKTVSMSLSYQLRS